MTRRDFVIEQVFKSQERQEGHLPWHKSKRNKNPLNLRRSPFAWFHVGGFAVFKTYEAGKAAALWDINQKLAKKTNSKVFAEKGEKATLKEYAYIWNPPSDNGPKGEEISANYLKNILWDLNLAGIKCKAESTFEELFASAPLRDLKILAVVHNVFENRKANLSGILGSVADYLEKRAFKGSKKVSWRVLPLPPSVQVGKTQVIQHSGVNNEVRLITQIDPLSVREAVKNSLKDEDVVIYFTGESLANTTFFKPIGGAVYTVVSLITEGEESVSLQHIIHEISHALVFMLRAKNYQLNDLTHERDALFDPRPNANLDSAFQSYESLWEFI